MRNSVIAILSFIVLACVVAVSCGKKTTLLNPDDEDKSGFEYAINNLRDTTMERIGEVRFLISVEKVSGTSESVLLSGNDLPEGMEVYFDPYNAIEAPFSTGVVIKAVRVPVGSHKINIKGASPRGGIKNNYITINILPYSNEAVGLKGTFTETGQCTQGVGAITDKVNVVVDEDVKNRIRIKGLFSGVMSNIIYADLDASSKTLKIPKQLQNEVTYEGEGFYDDDKIVINYTITGNALNTSCTSTLTRN